MADRCYFCNETECLEEHHIIPRRHGGSDAEVNLVDVCPTCHRKLESLYNARFYQKLGIPSNGDTTTSQYGVREFSERHIREADGKAISKDALYNFYVDFCENHGSKVAGRALFFRRLRKHIDYNEFRGSRPKRKLFVSGVKVVDYS